MRALHNGVRETALDGGKLGAAATGYQAGDRPDGLGTALRSRGRLHSLRPPPRRLEALRRAFRPPSRLRREAGSPTRHAIECGSLTTISFSARVLECWGMKQVEDSHWEAVGGSPTVALAGTSLREPVSPRLEGKRVPFQTPEVDLDIASFHAELRQRNLRNLFWTACIFNPVYLTWSIFDYVLLPTHWAHFLALRLGVVTVVTLVAISVHKFGLARYTWEAWVIVCLAYVNGVAPMLPLSGEYLPGYVLGFAVTFFATGLVPMWPPRWTMSVLLVSLGFSVAIFAAGWTGDVAVRDVVQSAFFVLTSAVISVYAAYFKYDLARRDYSSRAQLSAVAQRESEARLDLAQTSIDLQRALEDLKELRSPEEQVLRKRLPRVADPADTDLGTSCRAYRGHRKPEPQATGPCHPAKRRAPAGPDQRFVGFVTIGCWWTSTESG